MTVRDPCADLRRRRLERRGPIAVVDRIELVGWQRLMETTEMAQRPGEADRTVLTPPDVAASVPFEKAPLELVADGPAPVVRQDPVR